MRVSRVLFFCTRSARKPSWRALFSRFRSRDSTQARCARGVTFSAYSAKEEKNRIGKIEEINFFLSRHTHNDKYICVVC